MQMDLLTLGVGFSSFGIFLAIHFITFRWLRPERLLKSLFACVFAVAILPLVLMGILFSMKVVQASFPTWTLAAAVAMLVSMLLSFVYILCFFGPYETSIRMRLIREFARENGKRISHQELLERYNARAILNIRLRRLKGSGDIIEEEGVYRAGSTRNFFLLFDAISGVLKKWIGGQKT